MSNKRQEAAEQAAMQASEAGRVLQAQRGQSEDPPTQSDDPRPEPRNEPRRRAMEEIEKLDMERKGIIEPPKAEETPVDPPPPTPEQMLGGDKHAQPEPVEVPPEPTPEPAIKTVRVKVDGEEFDAPEEDVTAAGGITAYQRDKASENRLRKANEALAETRRTQAQIAEFLQKQQPQTPTLTPDQFIASKMDAIRFGTQEEATLAMREIMEKSNPRVDQNAITELAVSRMQQSLAVADFQKEFPDLVANPMALKLATTIENERVEQMKKAGYTPNWPSFYRQLGNEIKSAFGRPSQPTPAPVTELTTSSPSSVSSDKEARKASIVNLPTAAARAATPVESKPESREETLALMRKQRGLPTG